MVITTAGGVLERVFSHEENAETSQGDIKWFWIHLNLSSNSIYHICLQLDKYCNILLHKIYEVIWEQVRRYTPFKITMSLELYQTESNNFVPSVFTCIVHNIKAFCHLEAEI